MPPRLWPNLRAFRLMLQSACWQLRRINNINDLKWRRLEVRPIPSATCTVQTRKQVPRGAFFFMCQRGLQAPSALRRQTRRARSVSERPPSLSTRPSLPARRIQNSNRFQRTDGIALRPCFAGSGLSQSRWRRDTRGVFVGMSWESCAKSLMTKAVSALSLARCQTGPGPIKRTT